MFLNGIICYGVRSKACLLVFEWPTFDLTELLSYWEIGLSIALICRIFTYRISVISRATSDTDFSGIGRARATEFGRRTGRAFYLIRRTGFGQNFSGIGHISGNIIQVFSFLLRPQIIVKTIKHGFEMSSIWLIVLDNVKVLRKCNFPMTFWTLKCQNSVRILARIIFGRARAWKVGLRARTGNHVRASDSLGQRSDGSGIRAFGRPRWP